MKRWPTFGDVFDKIVYVTIILGTLAVIGALLWMDYHVLWVGAGKNIMLFLKILIFIGEVGFVSGSITICVKSITDWFDGGIVAEADVFWLAWPVLIFNGVLPGILVWLGMIFDATGLSDVGGGYKTPKVKTPKSSSSTNYDEEKPSKKPAKTLSGPRKIKLSQPEKDDSDNEKDESSSNDSDDYSSFREEIGRLKRKHKGN